MTQPQHPLSVRTWLSARRMHEQTGHGPAPKLEDYAHLDFDTMPPRSPAALPDPQPQPHPLTAVPGTADPAAVRAAFERMQAGTRVTFTPPPTDAA